MSNVRSRLAVVAVFVVACTAPLASAVDAPTMSVQVPMTDGTKLTSDVYLPQPEGSFPVVLCRSIYGRGADSRIDEALQAGFAAVLQDVRGMGTSEGKRALFESDGWQPGLTDGADTVAWIKAQPWCNGKIGTWGSSALGTTGLFLAPATKDLAAQFLEGSPANIYSDMIYQGGVYKKAFVEGWLPIFAKLDYIKELTALYKSHPRYDDYWASLNANTKVSDITAPAVFVTGWYDFCQQGVIDSFLARETDGGPGAKGENHLIIRWGTHRLRDETPDYRPNQNRFVLDPKAVFYAFFAKHMMGDASLMSMVAKVNYYTLGADTQDAPGNQWRTANTWPPFPIKATNYYMHSDGTLSPEPPTGAEDAKTFTFDPNDPLPTLGGANMTIKSGPFDQRPVYTERTDYLRFTTAPLEAPMEITGRVKVRLSVSSDAPDTDFTAKLVDIYPEGDSREILMLDSIRRVKTRLGYDKVAPLLTGPEQVVEIEVDLQSISCVFNTGHRIGLYISSSNYPRFDINPNTGNDFATAEAPARPARNTVHIDATHPSAIILPVRPAATE